MYNIYNTTIGIQSFAEEKNQKLIFYVLYNMWERLRRAYNCGNNVDKFAKFS